MTTETQNTALTDEDLFLMCQHVAVYYYHSRLMMTRAKTDYMMEQWGKLDNGTRNRVRVLLELADQEIAAHNSQVKATVTKIKALSYHRTWYKSAYFHIIDIKKVENLAKQNMDGWDIYKLLYIQP